MELVSVELADSPHGPERVRLTGAVKYDRGSPSSEQLWFDFPRQHAAELSQSGNAWLSALLPLAVKLNEPLRIQPPVDAKLLYGVRELNRVWHAWYPEVPVVTIEADPTAAAPSPAPARTAAFFSGGLDSFFTALRPREDERVQIDDLITVWGMDVPIENEAAGRDLFDRHQRIAAALGKGFVGVSTNLRTTRWVETDWEHVAHGPGLAAAGLLLEPRYHTVFIAATGGYRDLHFWGSHPLTDPLLSTAATSFVHDGAAFTRVEKTRLVTGSSVAMNSLRVCWRSKSVENCANCNKCYRTMLMLELLGALEWCSTFEPDQVDLKRASRIYCAYPWDFRELRDIEALARATGRLDVAEAVRKSMDRSPAVTRRLRRVRYFRRFGKTWRWSKRVEQYLLQNWMV
jgi:hypothetical protein